MLLDKFQVANAQPSKARVSDTAWRTNPTSPWYKINVDGAVLNNKKHQVWLLSSEIIKVW